jgi:hypothetical protein
MNTFHLFEGKVIFYNEVIVDYEFDGEQLSNDLNDE